MKTNNYKYIVCINRAGIGNRLKGLISAMRLSKITGRKLLLYWENNQYLGCDFNDLFENELEQINEKESEITRLKTDISNLENATGTKVGEVGEIIITKKSLGYLIDEMFLEIPFNDNLSDRELNLFDDEVEFDREDYDAEEILILDGLELRANDKDFEGVVYLTIPEDSISYKFVLEANLNTSKIGEDDETLTFDFLGKEVEVSEWKTTKITFTQGDEHHMVEKETVTVNGKDITLEFVLNDAAYITVDGEGKKIREGEVRRVNGIDIKADEVLFRDSALRENEATLIIGEDIEVIVNDGDEYSKDSIWEWTIDENSIGVVLIEDFLGLDEDFNALSSGDKICLPNDYVCIEYNGVIEENAENYVFELDTRNSIEYIRVKGNFISGINDYDTVYIRLGDDEVEDGIYDRDGSDFVLIDDTTIELGDTNSVLTLDGTHIVIEDFRVDMLLENLEVNDGTEWINRNSEDEDYRTLYGILIDNPEDSVEDKEFAITVPEEKLEGSITVKDFTFEEVAEETTANNETSQ